MTIILGILLTLALAGSAVAADDKKPTASPPTSQGEKMKVCSKEASDKQLKGDERRQFMSQCLRTGSKTEGAKEEKKS